MKNQLTQAHADQLREVLRGHPLEAILLLALITGMRRDELLRLTWQDLDWEKREVRVHHTKTKEGDRLIYLPEEMTQLLKQHRMQQVEARREAGTAWQNLDLVFSDRSGGFLQPEHLLTGFYALLEQAEVPRLRFHELRQAYWRRLHTQGHLAKQGHDGAPSADLDLGNNNSSGE